MDTEGGLPKLRLRKGQGTEKKKKQISPHRLIQSSQSSQDTQEQVSAIAQNGSTLGEEENLPLGEEEVGREKENLPGREEEKLSGREEELWNIKTRSHSGMSLIFSCNKQPDVPHQPFQPGSQGHVHAMDVLHENYEPQGDHALLESPEITLNTTND